MASSQVEMSYQDAPTENTAITSTSLVQRPTAPSFSCKAFLYDAISTRIAQTYILIWKNIIYSWRHLISTLVRLILPSLVLVGIFLLNNAISSNSTTVAGTNANREPIPRLPKDAVLVYTPCADPYAYCVMSTIAQNNDPALTVAPYGKCYGSIADCPYTICGLNASTSIVSTITKREKDIVGGVVFSYDFGTQDLKYSIMYNASRIVRNPFFPFDGSGSYPFDYSMSIQRALDESIIQLAAFAQNKTMKRAKIEMTKSYFPISLETGAQFAILPKDFVIMIGFFGFYIAAYLGAVYTHYSINNERSLKLIEALKMMGLKEFSFWTSWFITFTFYNIITSVMIVVMGYICQFLFFTKSNPVATFLLFFITGQSLIAMFMMFSTYIRSNICANINAFIILFLGLALMIFFVDIVTMIFPMQRLNNHGSSAVPLGITMYNTAQLDFLNMFPTYNFAKIVNDIAYKTRQVSNGTQYLDQDGYSFTDMFNRNLYNGTLIGVNRTIPSSAENMTYLFLSMIVFLVMAWYMDNVLPQKYGKRKPWYFPCLPSYWGLNRRGENLAIDVAAHKANRFASVLPDTDEDIYREYQSVINSLETDSNHEEYPIKIIKLSKTYSSLLQLHHSSKNALDNLTLSGSKSEVLVLLGHNGAGKSTCMNMMTGMYGPTAGDALMYGNSIVNDMENVRKFMGVCMQEDILWPELTGYQHMQLFATIKGIPFRQINDMIKQKLDQVFLWKYRNQSASTYSGGMKRRLSLAIAVLGDPKILMLDEPTTGMDPAIKRKIWNLITELKKDRTIVLTTHSMEEAEAVGDKIAIMALGRLRAVGTTLHLKNRYGAGYNVDIVSNDNVDDVKVKLAGLCPQAKLETEASGTLTYSLPTKLSKEVYQLFDFLETESKKQKKDASPALIRDWLISHTTLEEVFLRLTHGKEGVNIENQAEKPDMGVQQLNVIMENQPDALGFVDVDASTTLADARVLIQSNLTNAPQKFVYLQSGIPLSSQQEKLKMAATYLPLIQIRDANTVQQQQLQPASNVQSLQNQVQNLTSELDRLKQYVQKLEKENAEFKMQQSNDNLLQ